VSAYVASSKNLKDLKDAKLEHHEWVPSARSPVGAPFPISTLCREIDVHILHYMGDPQIRKHTSPGSCGALIASPVSMGPQ